MGRGGGLKYVFFLSIRCLGGWKGWGEALSDCFDGPVWAMRRRNVNRFSDFQVIVLKKMTQLMDF
jgi:hypothetical protein